MSYFIGGRKERAPGAVNGNAANGICERVLISVKKVFDAGIRQITLEGQQLTLTDLTIEPVYPLTFVSAQNSSSSGTLSNLMVERLEEQPRIARVTVDLTVPLTVVFVDANGNTGIGTTELLLPMDVMLSVPEPSIIPYAFEAIISAVASKGVYITENTFSLTLMLTTVIKIVIDADILIPSYGYAAFPPLVDYVDNTDSEFFGLPLYPENNPGGNRQC